MASSQKKIYVYENWSSVEPNKIGTLYFFKTKSNELSTVPNLFKS